MRTGIWRKRARIVIRDALDGVPAFAPEKEVRAFLREVYPFGPREHHPYRAWLAEVRRELQRRGFGRAIANGGRVLCLPGGVVCSWCDQKGCLICAQARARHAATDWQGWNRAVIDAATAPVLADWLDERGFALEAAYYRERP